MAIDTDQEFEAALAQLCRLYRGMRALWSKVDPGDQKQVAQWVTDAGRILEKLSQVLGNVEEYSSAMELRLIVDQMKTIREQRAGRPERV